MIHLVSGGLQAGSGGHHQGERHDPVRAKQADLLDENHEPPLSQL